uniref:Uncharacterized protein n=1 Tax=viral metagenome TaxID=1070528 RepID=A0A6M3LGQ8_9ZZZZ
MNELIKLLTRARDWMASAGRPLPMKPTNGKSGKSEYPASATEEEKLRIAKQRIRELREAEAKEKERRDIGGPFGTLPEKIGEGMKKVAGEKPKKGAKKLWYERGLF